jgi:bifunctional non-homologous end joining protein LigD
MPLAVMPQPWDHPDWLWEIKYDGFRSLACVEKGACRLVSRKHARYKAFSGLEAAVLATLDHDVVLDGEIVCLDSDGHPQFYDLLWHRAEPWFYAFDVLYLQGRDLRDRPLVERKRILRSLIPAQPCRILYADYVTGHGVRLFEAAVERDLEGVVAKHKQGLYRPEATSWVKVRNPRYSQGEGRRELFTSRRARLDGFRAC